MMAWVVFTGPTMALTAQVVLFGYKMMQPSKLRSQMGGIDLYFYKINTPVLSTQLLFKKNSDFRIFAIIVRYI